MKKLGLLLLTSSLAFANEENVRESWLSPLVIFGTQSELIEYPSEPQRLSGQKLENIQTTDVSRALKQVSGTYVREEDGVGLRPNIGLRGTNPDRSKKVTLMGDGILSGPAPYSAPAAYYTPSMLLTDSIEVYKGFSALAYGPNSVGGAVNYITTSVSSSPETSVKALTGSFNTNLLKISTIQKLSDSQLLFQLGGIKSDGFKEIDRGGDTGFEQKQMLLKWGKFLPHSKNLHHEIRFVLSYEDETSNETYLGLTKSDFENSYKRRYNASQLDEMEWTHKKWQIHHQYQLSDTSSVETSIYQHFFHRTWYRLDRFRDTTVNIRNILNNPSSFTSYYDILTGNQDTSSIGANGELIMANNDRNYYSQGIQTKWNEQINNHELEFSARFHQDQIKREHGADNYEMIAQQMVRTNNPRQIDTLNRESAQAITLFAQDHIRFGDWTFSPAVRYETVEFELKDSLIGTSNKREDDVMLPGFSVMKKLNSQNAIRISANKAATIAGLSSTGNEKREEADIYEVEWNYMDKEAAAEAQATLFWNDYRNITGTCTVSSGCTSNLLDTQFNGGKAKIYGLETKVGKNFVKDSYDFPVAANVTFIKSSFETEFNSTSPEWGIGLIKKGDPLPYVPEWLTSLSFGMRKGRYYHELTLSHQSKVYDQSAETGRQTIDAYGIVDWSGHYSYSAQGKIMAKIDNLLAREYAVAARPFGFRPGKPQSFNIGLQHGF